jgi:hypothetical protein
LLLLFGTGAGALALAPALSCCSACALCLVACCHVARGSLLVLGSCSWQCIVHWQRQPPIADCRLPIAIQYSILAIADCAPQSAIGTPQSAIRLPIAIAIAITESRKSKRPWPCCLCLSPLLAVGSSCSCLLGLGSWVLAARRRGARRRQPAEASREAPSRAETAASPGHFLAFGPGPGPGGPGAQRCLVRRAQGLLAVCLVRSRSAVSSPTSAPLFLWETQSGAGSCCCCWESASRDLVPSQVWVWVDVP